MANQQGRTSRARTRTTRTQSTQAAPRSASSSGATATVDPEELRAPKAVDWDAEYHYIIADLRQLLIISALLFAGLLVVGLFI